MPGSRDSSFAGDIRRLPVYRDQCKAASFLMEAFDMGFRKERPHLYGTDSVYTRRGCLQQEVGGTRNCGRLTARSARRAARLSSTTQKHLVGPVQGALPMLMSHSTGFSIHSCADHVQCLNRIRIFSAARGESGPSDARRKTSGPSILPISHAP